MPGFLRNRDGQILNEAVGTGLTGMVDAAETWPLGSVVYKWFCHNEDIHTPEHLQAGYQIMDTEAKNYALFVDSPRIVRYLGRCYDPADLVKPLGLVLERMDTDLKALVKAR